MISTRQARIDDYWRTCVKRGYPLKIDKIYFEHGEIFSDLSIELKPGINAIVGKNGVGKSNFVRAIFKALSTPSTNRVIKNNLIDQNNIRFEINLTKSAINFTSLSPHQGGIVEDFNCVLYDPCNLIPEIQHLICNQTNFDELLDGFSKKPVTDDELGLFNFITNTNYQKIEIIEVEDEFESFPNLPFFFIERADGAQYDSRGMGLGELSLFYYVWLVLHIKKLESPTVLFVEEPESFLPPVIQGRMCDITAMLCAEEGITALLSSHSEHILKKIPRSHIHIMRKFADGVKFTSADITGDQLKILGLTSPKKGILYTEDKAAKMLMGEILRYSTSFVKDSFFYHVSGSEGELLGDLKRFPKLSKFHCIAVFDGDCRDKEPSYKEFKKYVFLPTELPPEKVLISFLDSINHEELANSLGVNIENLTDAFGAVEGADHHDYFYIYSEVLEMEYEVLYTHVSSLWAKHPNNSSLVESFSQELIKVISD